MSLISEHRDGEIIARIVERLGFAHGARFHQPRRRPGAAGAVAPAAAGGRVAVTPDGPRGPAHRYAPGALVAAQRAGAPVVPDRHRGEPGLAGPRSWDRFVVPKPFATITVAYGPPTWVQAADARGAAAETTRFEAIHASASARAEEAAHARYPRTADGGRRSSARSRVNGRELVQALWFGDGPAARAGRVALAPLGRAFTGSRGCAGALYDVGLAPTRRAAAPVDRRRQSHGRRHGQDAGCRRARAPAARGGREAGGRAARLRRRRAGRAPRLNPGAIVVAMPTAWPASRGRAARRRRRRRARRRVPAPPLRRRFDLVLVSADRWRDGPRLGLPAGPWREPLQALRRASLVVVTRKAAGRRPRTRRAARGASARRRDGRLAVVRLEPEALRSPWADVEPASAVVHRRAPRAWPWPPSAIRPRSCASSTRLGATVVPRLWPDHHDFSRSRRCAAGA